MEGKVKVIQPAPFFSEYRARSEKASEEPTIGALKVVFVHIGVEQPSSAIDSAYHPRPFKKDSA